MAERRLEDDVTELADRLAAPYILLFDKVNEIVDHMNYLKEKVRRLESAQSTTAEEPTPTHN
jgi:hypothetical protein